MTKCCGIDRPYLFAGNLIQKSASKYALIQIFEFFQENDPASTAYIKLDQIIAGPNFGNQIFVLESMRYDDIVVYEI